MEEYLDGDAVCPHHYPESLRSGIDVLDKTQEISTNLAQSNEKGVTTNQ
jgi:hypothetical protein